MVPKAYTAFLFLEDGKFCQGWSFINPVMSVGEVVFNTGMTGYQEIMTDPSYCDQIILFTYPEIGNTGINKLDIESNRPYIKGLIAKNISLNSSNWRSSISFIDYLIKYKIPHIFGIDTRYLTKYLRNKGVMFGCITSNQYGVDLFNSKIKRVKMLQDIRLIDRVTTKKVYAWSPNLQPFLSYKSSNYVFYQKKVFTVVVIDYGVKFNILNILSSYGCNIIVVPSITSYETIMLKKPDGILLSNGPGDPSLIHYAIQNIQKLIQTNIPIFGICLGHQLLSLACGAQTTKLKFGHRGLNHPSGISNVVKMTSQNHGYVVSINSVPKDSLDVIQMNLNDTTVSGIVHKYKPCFSVQYHPEASPGPNDTDYLFTHFMELMSLCSLNY